MEDRKIDQSETEDERRQRQIELNQPLIALLDSWLEEDEEPTTEELHRFHEFMRNIDRHSDEKRRFAQFASDW